jgi:hypothetical protein
MQAIVFPAYRRGAAVTMMPVSVARTAMLLLASLVNARRSPHSGLREASLLARSLPACTLTWGGVDQIGDRIERWTQSEAFASARDRHLR